MLELALDKGNAARGCVNIPAALAPKWEAASVPARIQYETRQRIIAEYEVQRAERGIPWGYCFCGCNELAPIAKETIARLVMVKGHPKRFIPHHHLRYFGPRYLVEDRGYKTPCWIWQLFSRPDGYGMVQVNGKAVNAHRVEYEKAYGPIPEGMHIDHLCMSSTYGATGSRLCIRPTHLQALTPTEHKRTHSNVKLSEDKVRKIRRLAAKREMKQREIASLFGIDQAHVALIARRGSWVDVE